MYLPTFILILVELIELSYMLINTKSLIKTYIGETMNYTKNKKAGIDHSISAFYGNHFIISFKYASIYGFLCLYIEIGNLKPSISPLCNAISRPRSSK